MRVVVALAVAGGVAHAEPYPEAEVDRPLLHPEGMTTATVGLSFPQYTVLTVNPYDESASISRTKIAANRDPSVFVQHAFDGFELGASVAGYADNIQLGATARFDAGPGAIVANAGMLMPYGDSGISHDFEESLFYGLKVALVPGTLGFEVSGGVGMSELGYHNFISGTSIYATAQVEAIVQVLPNVALTLAQGIARPIAQEAELGDPTVSLSSTAVLQLVFGRTDAFARVGVDNESHLALFSFGFGVTHRFGG